MAPIKFEENLKEKLEKRTLEPSSNSWDTLSQRLDNEENKNDKRGYFWLAIAASIIGLSFIIYPFFSNDIKLPEGNEVFVSDTNENEVKTDVELSNKTEAEAVIVTEEVVENKVINTEEHTPKIEQNKTQYLANYKAELPNEVKKNEAINTIQNSIKNNAANASLAVVVESPQQELLALNNDKDTVLNSSHSIDALLASAQQDLTSHREHTKVKIPIDHNALLQDVEDDLEETFKDKLFNKVRKGYSSIKQEFAERND